MTMSVTPLGATAPVLDSSEALHSGHVVQFYTDDGFVMDSLADFLGSALSSGDSAIVIATREHLEGIAQRLDRQARLDFVRALEEGRYFALDAEETLAKFMDGDLPDADRFQGIAGDLVERARDAALSPERHVVAFGEMVAVLWEQGHRHAAIRLEELWNGLAQTHLFSLRCAYPIGCFSRSEDAEDFARVCGTHSTVIPEESYTALASEEERLRSVSRLQQSERALASATETRVELMQKIEEHQRSEAQLSKLSARLMRVQDEERRSVARELHESIGQDLIALQMNLQTLESEDSGSERNQLLAEAKATISQCVGQLRLLSYVLHPPLLDEVGLVAALSWYARGFSHRSAIRVELDLPTQRVSLGSRVELTLFRIVQESLSNVHRHSGSRTAGVRLVVSDTEAMIEVTDRGRGFTGGVPGGHSTNGDGLGLSSMRSRLEDLGGSLDVESSSAGVLLRATIPLSQVPLPN